MTKTSNSSNRFSSSVNRPANAAKHGTYHHGNLRLTLIEQALEILEQQGVSALSMRALADRIGVSRSALYHHFKNKEDLLSAIAGQGFRHLNSLIEQSLGQTSDEQDTPQNGQSHLAYREHVFKAVSGYLSFATEHAAQYDLMFGKALWNTQQETAFQRYAKDCFRHFVELFERMQEREQLSQNEPPLRLAQIFWSSLHGLAKLMNEDILTVKQDQDILAQHLVNRFI